MKITDIKVVPMRMPVETYIAGIRTARSVERTLRELENAHTKKYPVADVEMIRSLKGEEGVEEYVKDCEILETNRITAIKGAASMLESIRQRAFASIDEAITPSGEDITGENAADVALFKAGLIQSPESLNVILSRHNNVAFRSIAEKYAAERGWEGYSFMAKEETIREYTDQIFKGLKAAIEDPGKIASMQYVGTADEYARMAEGYGILKEFNASGGGRIEAEIKGSATE